MSKLKYVLQNTHFLVDGQKVDVRLLHGEQEDESAALIADACCTPTPMNEGAERERERNWLCLKV